MIVYSRFEEPSTAKPGRWHKPMYKVACKWFRSERYQDYADGEAVTIPKFVHWLKPKTFKTVMGGK